MLQQKMPQAQTLAEYQPRLRQQNARFYQLETIARPSKSVFKLFVRVTSTEHPKGYRSIKTVIFDTGHQRITAVESLRWLLYRFPFHYLYRPQFKNAQNGRMNEKNHKIFSPFEYAPIQASPFEKAILLPCYNHPKLLEQEQQIQKHSQKS